MSNGYAGVGQFTVQQDEGEVELSVTQWWTSSSAGAGLQVAVADRDPYELDMTRDEARQLIVLLLTAAGDRDVADALMPALAAAAAQIDARERARREAWAAWQAAQEAAAAEFRAATAEQRAAYNARLDAWQADHPGPGYELGSRAVYLGEREHDPWAAAF